MEEKQSVYEKHPLGLRPRIFALEDRAREVEAAIKRYEDAGVDVPKEWHTEFLLLCADIHKIRIEDFRKDK